VADYSRMATKWRCATGECKPVSVWIKAERLHPLNPARDAALAPPIQAAGIRRACVRQAQE